MNKLLQFVINMYCPTISELPVPPEGKTGWPWTEESASFSDTTPDDFSWPRISIITPSFNQGKYIEETIRSVILQGYPNLEYIVLDGDSTDNSVEIIKNYEKYIDYWVSEPDNGQADAIYRGIEMATGDIIAYINSDDIYYPGAFYKIAEKFTKNPVCSWLTGKTVFIDEVSIPTKEQPKYLPINMFTMVYLGNFISQQSTFWKKDFYSAVGGFDRNLQFGFDYELFLKFLNIEKPLWMDDQLTAFRSHPMSKTSNLMDVCFEEFYKINENYKKSDGLIRKLAGNILGHLYKHIFAFRH